MGGSLIGRLWSFKASPREFLVEQLDQGMEVHSELDNPDHTVVPVSLSVLKTNWIKVYILPFLSFTRNTFFKKSCQRMDSKADVIFIIRCSN